jgi:hypothetical protein
VLKKIFIKIFPAIDQLYDTYTYDFISKQSEPDLLRTIEDDFDLFGLQMRGHIFQSILI